MRATPKRYDPTVEIIAKAAKDEAVPLIEIVAPYIGASIVPVLAALFGAAASTTISHFLTKRRDAAAEKRQEARDVRTADRHSRELAEQRRETNDEQAKRDRIAAVKSFYSAYVAALTQVGGGWQSLQTGDVQSAAREFALQIKPLSPASAKRVRDLLTIASRRGYNYEAAYKALKAQKIEVFEELMTWAITNDRDAMRRAFSLFVQRYAVHREGQS